MSRVLFLYGLMLVVCLEGAACGSRSHVGELEVPKKKRETFDPEKSQKIDLSSKEVVAATRLPVVDGSRSFSVAPGNDMVVQDAVTGLDWQRTVVSKSFKWKDALEFCSTLTYGGYSDWRLPTINELITLIDFTKDHPAIDTVVFPDTVPEPFWSSTTYVFHKTSAWGVYFGTGQVYHYRKEGKHFVRCVRRH